MGLPRRPPGRPATGANALPVDKPRQFAPRPPAPAQANNGGGPENVNQVDTGNTGPYRRDDYQEAHQTYVIFTTEATDKKSLQRRAMEVNAVMPAVPKFLHWSEQEINWSRKDTPRVMPTPGGYALIVEPTFMGPTVNVKFTRVLIDNGSSINIMYRDTMVKMGISPNMLQPTITTFHGIVQIGRAHV